VIRARRAVWSFSERRADRASALLVRGNRPERAPSTAYDVSLRGASVQSPFLSHRWTGPGPAKPLCEASGEALRGRRGESVHPPDGGGPSVHEEEARPERPWLLPDFFLCSAETRKALSLRAATLRLDPPKLGSVPQHGCRHTGRATLVEPWPRRAHSFARGRAAPSVQEQWVFPSPPLCLTP